MSDRICRALAVVLALGVGACSSSSNNNGTGGSGGSTGGSGGGGGSGGSGGSPGGSGETTVDAAPVTTPDAGAVDAGTTPPDAGIDAAATADAAPSGGAFAVTAPWMNNGMIDPMYTCAGGQHFPAISWSDGPAGTMSYALVFFDTANMLEHIAMYNIPASAHSMPPLPVGTKLGPESATTDATWRGPCPGGKMHVYELTIYALKTAAYAGPTDGNEAIRNALENKSNADVLGKVVVAGSSNAQR